MYLALQDSDHTMKTAFFFLLISTHSLLVTSQNQMYLERKDAEEQSTKSTSIFAVTTNKAGDKLVLSTTKLEFDTPNERKRTNYYSKVLNMNNGDFELVLDGSSVSFVDDYLIELSSPNSGGWQSLTEFTFGNNKFRNSENYGVENLQIPEGYTISAIRGEILGVSNFNEKKSAILQKTSSGYERQFEIAGFIFQISEDGQKIYSFKLQEYDAQFKQTAPPKIFTYDMSTGNLIEERATTTFMKVRILKDGTLVRGFFGKSIFVEVEGKEPKEFKGGGGMFEINDEETELLTYGSKGAIRLWNLKTGDLLGEVTDTYIPEVETAPSGMVILNDKKVTPPVKVMGGDYYLFPTSTGLVSVFSSKERKVVANMFFDKRDWAVIAKDGRIDGTPGALEKLEWRAYDGDKVTKRVSIESVFDKYYTPGLLPKILNGGEAAISAQIQRDIAEAPVLTIETIDGQRVITEASTVPYFNSTQKNISLVVRAGQFNENIKEIRLYQNRKLIAINKGNSTGNYPFDVSLNAVNGEKNPMYAVASSHDGIDSEKSKVVINYKNNKSQKAKLYALVVGVNKYKNPKYELNYAYPDALALKEQLLKSKSSLFETIEVKTLFDDQVTKQSIKNAFESISSKTNEQDIFLFYYAGHGTMAKQGTRDEFYIVPHDVLQLYGNDALIKEKAVSADEIKTLSMNMNAQKQVFMFDACHSAGALNTAATRGAAEEIAIAQLARSTGTFWLTAAGSDQYATEFDELGHGVFTYSLLEVLQGKDQGSASDGTISIREMSSYVERRVPELSRRYKGKPQYPASFSFGNDFPLLLTQ